MPTTTPQRTWFGHPRGLATLFFTEMWERFSYYGMRAILVLALVDAVSHGGQGLNDRDANAIYGLYIAGVYVLSLAGGWIGDRLSGHQRALLIGGFIIATGHFTMALPFGITFYLGMLIIVLGTGLFKPAVSTLVGLLYNNNSSATSNDRRDAGFSIFYMGINLGSFIGQIVCGYLGERVGWRYGFGAAGVFMLLGLTQFAYTRHHLGNAGLSIARSGNGVRDSQTQRRAIQILSVCAVLLVILVMALAKGWLQFDAVQVATNASKTIAILTVCYFLYIILFGNLTTLEKRRVCVIMIMVFVAAIFWAGYEQTGSSFNLFAQRYTDRMLFGWEVPASWLQAISSFFIVALAPVFAALWIRLGARQLDPSTPVKLGIGLIQLGLGFLVLCFAAQFVVLGQKVAPTWLVITYLLHTTGELCLSPVGLSAVTKLAPARYAGQMMGLWFTSNALGNVIAGLIAGHLGSDSVNAMPQRFFLVFAVTASVGGLLVLLAARVNRLTRAT